MFGTRQSLREFFAQRMDWALREVSSVDQDVLTTEHVDVLVAAVLDKHMPVAIDVHWDSPTASPITEVITQVRDQFDQRTYDVAASRIVVSHALTGTSAMLDYDASTFSMSGPGQAKISSTSVDVEVVDRALDADRIKRVVGSARTDVSKRIGWANVDLAQFLVSAEQNVRAAVEKRRARVLSDRALQESLGIPVASTGSPPPAVPARRKHVSLSTRTTQSASVPEPVLDDAIYQDVLDAVRAWSNSLERAPRTAEKLDEEELRDLLLANLNSYWQGGAGGELFNGSGKTDILIRHDDRNVFIGECKVWHGPKGVAEALDQLRGYMVWRDSKAALVMFIKTADSAATVAKLHAAVEAHPSHVLTKASTNPTHRADYVVTADDEGRRVSLAVIPVVLSSGP